MTLSDLGWLSKIFNDTTCCAVSLRQLSFLLHFLVMMCLYPCLCLLCFYLVENLLLMCSTSMCLWPLLVLSLIHLFEFMFFYCFCIIYIQCIIVVNSLWAASFDKQICFTDWRFIIFFLTTCVMHVTNKYCLLAEHIAHDSYIATKHNDLTCH